MDALEQVLAAESQLELIAQTFLEKCSALESVVSSGSIDASTLKALTHRIRARTDPVENTGRTVTRSHTMLKSLVNRSPQVVPVQQLPPEILSRIFTYAIAEYCGYVYSIPEEPLVGFTSVCSYWRRVAIRTSSLWSHVDMSPGPMYGRFSFNHELAKLWLERSRKKPLHIHFGSSGLHANHRAHSDGISHLVETLSPFTHQIASLHFPRYSSSYLIKAVFKILEKNAVSGNLRALFVENIEHAGLEHPAEPHSLPWPVQHLQNLVCLQISGLDFDCSPNLDQLFRILLSSPGLHTLQLRSIDYRNQEGEYPVIELPELRFLDLRELGGIGLLILLPRLICTRRNVHFEADISNNEVVATVTAEFMARTHITSLGLWQTHNEDYSLVRHYLSSTKTLRALMLEPAWGDVQPILDALTLPIEHALPRFPDLKTLLFINAILGPEDALGIQDFVQTGLLRSIGLVDWGTHEDLNLEEDKFVSEVVKKIPNISFTSYDTRPMEGKWMDFIQKNLLGDWD